MVEVGGSRDAKDRSEGVPVLVEVADAQGDEGLVVQQRGRAGRALSPDDSLRHAKGRALAYRGR